MINLFNLTREELIELALGITMSDMSIFATEDEIREEARALTNDELIRFLSEQDEYFYKEAV